MGCTVCLGLFVMLQPSIHTADILFFPASSSQCWVCRRGGVQEGGVQEGAVAVPLW